MLRLEKEEIRRNKIIISGRRKRNNGSWTIRNRMIRKRKKNGLREEKREKFGREDERRDRK